MRERGAGAAGRVAALVLTLLFAGIGHGAGRQEQKSVTMTVRGMMCSSCAGHVERTLKGLPGVVRVAVDLRTDRVEVGYREGRVTPRQMVEALARAGYRAQPVAAVQTPGRAPRAVPR